MIQIACYEILFLLLQLRQFFRVAARGSEYARHAIHCAHRLLKRLCIVEDIRYLVGIKTEIFECSFRWIIRNRSHEEFKRDRVGNGGWISIAAYCSGKIRLDLFPLSLGLRLGAGSIGLNGGPASPNHRRRNESGRER